MMDGCVYFITDGTGAVKIGYSGAPLVRMESLQTAHHRELDLMGEMPGTKEDEEALHRRFAHLRIRGEWFRGDPELTDFIGSIELPTYVPIEKPHQEIRMDPSPRKLSPVAMAALKGESIGQAVRGPTEFEERVIALLTDIQARLKRLEDALP